MKLSHLLAWTILTLVEARLPVIDVGNAQYQGTTNVDAGVSSYLGIRYAAAPVGNLRWRAPQPPPALSGIQNASSGPQCLQAPQGSSATNPLPKPTLQRRVPLPDFETGSEDCLFLNVYIPGSSIPKHKLPVIVWIHGGGYILGNATIYDATNLVQVSQEGVIVVVIQYRLGVYGFLSGPEIKDDGSLNAGLLDQEFALKWVQTHISKFGGDPKQVTIWGESAGAGSVLQQVIARNGRTRSSIFRAAIASSPFIPPQYWFNSTIPKSIYHQVVAQLGCGNSTNTLSCLRGIDVSLLQAANIQINSAGFFGTFTTVPVVDGDFITQRPIEALRQKRVNGRALLVTSNPNEGFFFVDQTTAGTVTAADYVSTLFSAFGPEEATTVAQLYEGLGTPIEQANLIHGEAIFVCPAYYLLHYPKAYKGEYAIPPGFHGDDVGAYFPGFQPPTFDNPIFITSFSQSFINFARKLDPNFKFDSSNITPKWPQYATANGEMVFNRTEDGQPDIRVSPTDSGLLRRCAFWESVGHLTRQ